MKKEIRIFFTALMFYTRIPCPKWVNHSPEYLNASARYLSLIGIIVGGIGAVIYFLSSYILPHSVSILLSMGAILSVTGAFHEDGFADMCDGFGGGWTKEKILRIMKDSRIGTYGVVGLAMLLSLKFFSLNEMDRKIIPLVLIAGHSLSRFVASTLLSNNQYVRDTTESKAGSATKKLSVTSLIVNAIFGIAPLFFFENKYVFILILPLLLAKWYLARYFTKWIGGYTGDCAGAVQQVSEVVFYLSFLVLWKFI